MQTVLRTWYSDSQRGNGIALHNKKARPKPGFFDSAKCWNGYLKLSRLSQLWLRRHPLQTDMLPRSLTS